MCAQLISVLGLHDKKEQVFLIISEYRFKAENREIQQHCVRLKLQLKAGC